MNYRRIQVSALKCTCSKCGYQWVALGLVPPKHCANKQCRSREWAGKKQQRSKIKLPAPRKAGRPKTYDPTIYDYEEDP